MDGNEIITVHLGPYANYVGAFLINHEHLQTFGTSQPAPVLRSEEQHFGNSQTNDKSNTKQSNLQIDPYINFQPNKKSENNQKNAHFIPRAIFCDFEGAVPVKHANQIAMDNFSKTQQNVKRNIHNLDYDPLTHYEETFSSYQPMYSDYDTNNGVNKPSNNQTPIKQANIITHEHLYWHNILYPHLRPMTAYPERLILTAASHVLGLPADVITESNIIMQKPTSSTSSKHEDTFGETLFDQFRTLVESCDHPQGVRIILDSTSIWGGIGLSLLQHILSDYPTLQTVIISVSTPYNLDSTSSTVMSEIFSQNCHIIPYSPFSLPSGTAISPAQIKSQAIALKETRVINSTLFISHILQEESCAYVPIVFPLTKPLEQFISTKIPQLIHQYRGLLTKLSQSGENDTNISKLSPETQSNLAALSTTLAQQYNSVLYHYLTAPHISAALSSLFLPLTLSKSTSASSGHVISLSQLIHTIRPRTALPVATLAHRQDVDLYSYSVFGKTSDDNEEEGGNSDFYSRMFTDCMIFPMLNVPNLGQVPILTNLYPIQQQKQIQQYEKNLKSEKKLTFTNHSTNPGQDVDIGDLYGNESAERIDPIAVKRAQTIQVGNSYTIGHFDTTNLSLSQKNQEIDATKRVINGVYTATDTLQYEYECEQRHKRQQRDLYTFFSTTRPSSVFILPENLYNPPSTPSVIYNSNVFNGFNNLTQVFNYLDCGKPLGELTNKTNRSNAPAFKYLQKANKERNITGDESLSSVFISPQLEGSFKNLAANLKRNERSMTKRMHYNSIEQDDWYEYYNNLVSVSSEYKELDVYQLGDFE